MAILRGKLVTRQWHRLAATTEKLLCVWERNSKPHGHTLGYPFLWRGQERVNPGGLLAWPSWNKSAGGSQKEQERQLNSRTHTDTHICTHIHPQACVYTYRWAMDGDFIDPRVYFLPRKSLGSHSGSGNAPGFESLAGQSWLGVTLGQSRQDACMQSSWLASRQAAGGALGLLACNI